MKLWYEVSRSGLLHSLVADEVFPDVSLSSNQKRLLAEKARETKNRIIQDSIDLRRWAIDELLADLKAERAIKKDLGELYYSVTNLEVLALQLDYSSDGGNPVRFHGLAANDAFLVGLDGGLQARPASARKSITNTLGPALNSGAIQMTAEQTAAWIAIKEEQSARIKELNRWISESVEDRVDRATAVQMGMVLREQHEALAKKLDRGLLELLTDSQVAQLEQLSLVMDVVRRGYVAAIVDGDLGRRLGVTKQQKDDLLDKAKQIRAKVISKLTAWQGDCYANILLILTPQQRAALGEAVGDISSHELRGFTVFLADLEDVAPN